MIQLIGLMLASYISVRMLELMARRDLHWFVGIAALLTWIFTGYCAYRLLVLPDQILPPIR